ncbi:energy transducer TonB [Sphingobacterium spiritivorum]|uniref:energy transducer TonB n=1 Tax=Sphingobacterium spiritivorum TaxID=258 RepID=UPI003DA3C3E3
MMTYLIMANCSMLVLYMLYYLLLRKLTFFQWNRVYLIVALLVSLIVPALQFMDFSDSVYAADIIPVIKMNMIAVQGDVIVLNPKPLTFSAIVVYWVTVGVAVVYFLIRLLRIFRLFKKQNPNMSFSFLQQIYVGDAVANASLIYAHEDVHVKQGHTYDILFVEIVRIFNWFNPVLYFYIKELKFQHECIADQICSGQDKRSYAEVLVANAMSVPAHVMFHEFSNQSFLKKRIMMLFQNRSKSINRIKYVLLLPLTVGLGVTALAFNKISDVVKTDLVSKVMDVHLPVPDAPSFQRQEVEVEDKKPTQQQEPVVKTAEVLPEPPGGMKAFMTFIGQNYVYPDAAVQNKVNGIVTVAFIVEKDGSLSNFKITKDMGYGTGEEAIRVLKMAEKWKPGLNNGKAVRVAYTVPLRLVAASATQNTETEQRDISPKAGVPSPPDEYIVLTKVEKGPEPTEGFQKFMMFIGNNYQYPSEAVKSGVNGKILLTFVVEKDGSLTDFKIAQDLGYGTGEAGLAVLKKYNQKWTPGVQNGRPVRVMYMLPIQLNTVD